MKKFVIVIIILLLASCAGKQGTPYVVPQYILDRPARHDFNKAYDCLKLKDDGETSKLAIHPSKEPNGWVNGNNDITLTAGLFEYDDDIIIFVITHELAHAKLKHVRNQRIVSYTTTGAMMVVGALIPGAGLLNYAVNPAVTNNFSKSQEYDADRLASETLVTCFHISVEQQIHILETLQKNTSDGGGFWATHPAWADRLENIRKPHSQEVSPAHTP